MNLQFITARKRILRRLCFYRCLSVHTGGACVVLLGGVWFYLGGCAWFYSGVRGFISGGHVWFFQGGHAWFFRGACMVFSGGHAWFFQFFRIQSDTVNEWAVRILLECILMVTILSGHLPFQGQKIGEDCTRGPFTPSASIRDETTLQWR